MQTWLSRLLFVLVLDAAAPSLAATYYVAKRTATVNASDSHSCSTAQNPATPKSTLQSAVRCLTAGDTLLVRGGTYTGDRIQFQNLSGREDAWITVKTYPGETAVLDGTDIQFFNSRYIEVADFEMTNTGFMKSGYFNDCGVFDDACQANVKQMCDLSTVACQTTWASWRERYRAQIYISSSCCASGLSDHLIIRNNHIHHAASGGINGTGRNIQILNNHIHHLGIRGWGMAYPMYLTLNDSVIRGNICHDTSGTDGMRFADYPWKVGGAPMGVNNIIEQNKSYGHGGTPWYAGTRRNGGNGITFYPAGNGNLVRNNLLFGNRGHGIQNSKGTANYLGTHYVYNNTFYGNGFEAIQDNSSSHYRNNIGFNNRRIGGQGDFNAGAGSTSSLQNNLFGVDPLFVDPSAHNFGLNVGSPAIDKGMTLKEVPKDFVGAVRPQGRGIDVGAFERVMKESVPAPPAGFEVN